MFTQITKFVKRLRQHQNIYLLYNSELPLLDEIMISYKIRTFFQLSKNQFRKRCLNSSSFSNRLTPIQRFQSYKQMKISRNPVWAIISHPIYLNTFFIKRAFYSISFLIAISLTSSCLMSLVKDVTIIPIGYCPTLGNRKQEKFFLYQ